MSGKRLGKSLGTLLREGMESGTLRENGCMLLNVEECSDQDSVRKYNEMIRLLTAARMYEGRTHEEIVRRALKLWREIEPELPVLDGDDIRKIVRSNVGFVDFEKCISAAFEIGKYARPVRFTEVKESVRHCSSFEKLRERSLNRVLSRVLRYLEQSCMLVRTWEYRKSGNRVNVLYFRLYRISLDSDACKTCWVADELRRILERLR